MLRPRKRRHDVSGEAAQIVPRALSAEQHVIDPGLTQCVELCGDLVRRADQRMRFARPRRVGISQNMRGRPARRAARQVEQPLIGLRLPPGTGSAACVTGRLEPNVTRGSIARAASSMSRHAWAESASDREAAISCLSRRYRIASDPMSRTYLAAT